LAQLADRGIDDEPVLVAPIALEWRVLAEEREPGAAVVEGGLASLSPVDQVEVPALVLVMALAASPLRGREESVEAAVLGDPLLQLGVAVEAALIRELPAGDVAPGAIGEAFEIGVPFVERPWREHLAVGRGREAAERQQDPT